VQISDPNPRYPAVLAIPARNERAHIAECLRAAALQEGRIRHAILLLLNNTTDGTEALVRRLQPTLPCPVHVIEHRFPPGEASAGQARRLAMSLAAGMTEDDGVLLTTDADGRVAPDWIETNFSALRHGADAVCGRAVIDPDDAARIPAQLHADEDRVSALGELLDEIHALFDPDPADPWPRHTEHSGASIAVRKTLFHRAGGVPPLPTGEDRAFLANLRRVDARIRHAPEVYVTVSGRIEGRAVGGMADTIRRRMIAPDALLDDIVEPAADCARRAKARHRLFRLWHVMRTEKCLSNAHARTIICRAAAFLGLQPESLCTWLHLPYFGTAWSAVEQASPVLRRHRLRPAQWHTEMRNAEAILAAGYAAASISERQPTRLKAPARRPRDSSLPDAPSDWANQSPP
jgi:GT2 family glycosyltransferase